MSEKIMALVLLAGMKHTEAHKLPNGYCRTNPEPWMLFVVEGGTFTIGWRKRVISVEWTVKDADPITEEDLKWITHGPRHFHAYDYQQALLFLTRVVKQTTANETTGPAGVVQGAKA